MPGMENASLELYSFHSLERVGVAGHALGISTSHGAL